MGNKIDKISMIEGTIHFFTTKEIGIGEKILVSLLLGVYIFSPIDMIPDMIPVIGWLDDIGVSCLALWYFNYRVSKIENRKKTAEIEGQPSDKPEKLLMPDKESNTCSQQNLFYSDSDKQNK